MAVAEAVTAAKTTSWISVGLAPPVSVKKTLCTLAADAAGVAWEDVNVIKSTLEPLAPAVKAVTKDPAPDLSVFAAAIVDTAALGVRVKIGCVFAAIVIYFYVF